ncbi:hypothetical protein U9K52_08365 [Chryseobacterium sp. MHB01]|uniref:hypothetical protein n=1 Tax=Chryseobacterium sp. MHB01 TaxID=3109433 RepID=UPI002AFF33A8|nr:hypothetical protein [Chryseobacterium sp. MHB01]MEA1848921.1 hypothetical protein [Chryseobacterium sp. MHB01]
MKKKLQIQNPKIILKRFNRKLAFKTNRKVKRRLLNSLRSDLRKNYSYLDRKLNTYNLLRVPNILSLNKDPYQFVDFIKKFENLKSSNNKKPFFFDLLHVEELDFSGISLLIALRYKLKLYSIDFNGRNPKKQELCNLLGEYQFLEQMGIVPSYEDIHFSLGKKNDKITIKGDSKVKPELGIEIADYVSNKLFGKAGLVNDGLQTMLLELMANTFKWSSQPNGHNLWLLTMSFNKIEKRIEFQFIDFGIGVFESLKNSKVYEKWFGYALNILQSNSNIFKDMLNANSNVFKSSTGLYFRGKGIPSIKENYEKRFYDDVNILTNNIFVDLKNEKYINLADNFTGTLVNWTIDANNEFIQLL